ncbi:precorrin-3B C(17)-methyltransferase [Thermovorax subterraneus]|nr:precorrin-3B C(17)-methyltransferase [Thermovorax subterraneus]
MSWIKVVGIGPGSMDDLTPRALRAIVEADAVVGYVKYLKFIDSLVEGKTVVASGMRTEAERCKKAIELHKKGLKVSVISGGDPGIYGMAGLLLELAAKEGLRAEIEVVPGITALNFASSLLGAPIMQDFAAISLSDHLTPWQIIEKRLDMAAAADFVIALYNPASSERPGSFKKACDILMKHKKADTPVGIVKNAFREGEWVKLTTLFEAPDYPIDMNTIVIVGSSSTKVMGNWMITPRGYEI